MINMHRLIATAMLIALLMAGLTLQAQPKLAVGPNQPVGEGKGIYPARVVWTHAPGMISWEKGKGQWHEDRWNNQQDADRLVTTAVTGLTGKKKPKAAWKALFEYYNRTHDKGKHGYKKGERIAVKLNMNNTAGYQDTEEINASPFVTLALVRSMVHDAGIPEDCITLFDASRFVTDSIYNKIHREFPRVHIVDNEGTYGREKARYKDEAIKYSRDNGPLARGLALCAVDADYLINVALLKGHNGQGVTLCGKNWYGATSINRDYRKNHHNHFIANRSGRPSYVTFTDFMAHKDMGGKTILYLIDGTYGSRSVAGPPAAKWNMEPFNGQWPCSLFASQDPVAIDAVGTDFLIAEFPTMPDLNYCDMYLLEAAKADNAPSGTVYDPDGDGIAAGSLGLLEHWNNPHDKHYDAIDLQYIRL